MRIDGNHGSSRFQLGGIYATPGALEALANANTPPAALLSRHLRCDWGEIDEEDAASNEEALAIGERLMSVYRLSNQVKIWVITERDRSYTTLLLPAEY